MAPKKKRTKEEIAAEKAKREDEARLAEEERLRKEEEARIVAEQHEQARQELLQQYRATENARLQQERQELLPFLRQLQHDRAVAAREQSAHVDWQRHLSCKPLPDPRIRSDMNDFFVSLAESGNHQLEHALEECEKCVALAQDCSMRAIEQTMSAAAMTAIGSLAAGGCIGNSKQARDSDIQLLLAQAGTATAEANAQAAQYRADAAELYAHVARKMDIATAEVLQYADRQADEKGDVLLTAQQGCVQWGLWVNTHKNPRFKLIDFGGIGMTVDIPKQLALASIAVRVQRRPGLCPQLQQQQQQGSSSEAAGAMQNAQEAHFVPLGSALQVDLLALPPGAKQSKGWTMRQTTGLCSSVCVVPYPIPPAGADLSTWQPDEEPPPLTFTVTLPPNLLVPAHVRVGWWDDKHSTWSQEGISGVVYNPTGCLTFSSIHLGCLAILQDPAAALPYRSWAIRPTGGLGAGQAAISIQVANQHSAPATDGDNPSSASYVVLHVARGTLTLAGPCLPQLSHLLGQPMAPYQLLAACEECGLRLMPGAAEARAVGLQEKDAAMEGAMCANLALLSGNFLMASSRWNLAAGPAAALCRLSEVTDWEQGGRTDVQHTARIFTREVQEGERRVLIIMQQALEGVMFVNGANNRMEPPCPCDFSTVQRIEAAANEPYGHLHSNVLHLLAGPHGGLVNQPNSQDLATPDPLVRATDAIFSLTMQQTLQALRLLTFV